MLSWATKRQLLYFFISALFLTVLLFVLWKIIFPPTCFDNKQNQGEEGIDCGGPCTKECLGEIKDINIIWSKALSLGNGKYDLIAMIENPNQNLFADDVKYTFNVYDKNNVLIFYKEGKTYLSPGKTFPLFIPNVSWGEKIPASTYVDFSKDIKWKKEKPVVFSLVVSKKVFSNYPNPKLELLLENKTSFYSPNLKVAVLIYDKNRNVVAASISMVDSIPPAKFEKLIFTWPVSFENIPASEDIEVIFNPLD